MRMRNSRRKSKNLSARRNSNANYTRPRYQKDNPVGGMIPVSSGQPKHTPRNYEQLAREGYIKNNVVFSSVNVVSDACAQAVWALFQRNADGTETPVLSHPILNLLNKPNPSMGKTEFIKSVIAYKQLSGNTYINAVSPNVGEDVTAAKYDFEPKELWVNRSDRYKVIQGTTAPVAGYEYSAHGQDKKFPQDQITGKSNVLHWKTFHPLDDYYGMSAIEAAAACIDIYNHSLDWNNAFFANGARPSGAMIYSGEGKLGDNQFNDLKKQVDEIYTGTSNNGRPMVLDHMEWKQFSLSPKDMDFIAAKDTTAIDIARAFGVDPSLLNLGSSPTYNNKAEARLGLYEDVAIPEMINFAAELNTWLVPRYGDDSLILKVDFSNSPALEIKREKMWERANKSTDLTINETRALKGYGPVEGGDQVFQPSSNIPITFDIAETANNAKKGEAVKSLDDIEVKQSPEPFEFKLLNGSRRAEKRELAIQDRLMKTLERPFAKQVNKILERYALAASKQGKAAKLNEGDMKKDLMRIYVPQYRKTMDIFGKRIIGGLKCLPSCLETKDQQDLFLEATNEWIKANAADRVKMVTDTTKGLIKDAVATGIAQEATGIEMSKLIYDATGGSIAKNRSVVISRTETLTASQRGSLAAADSTGLDLKKIVISAEDERARSTHTEADAETHNNPIGLDEYYSVGSDRMQHPGGGSTAEENCNCRCVLGYVTE